MPGCYRSAELRWIDLFTHHLSATNSLGDIDVEPVGINGNVPTEILSGASNYDPEGPGWVVHCAHAQLRRYSFSEARTVVSVRVRGRAR